MNASAFLDHVNEILAIELETQRDLAHARKAAARNVRHFAESSHRVAANDHPAVRILILFLSKRSHIFDHALKVHMPTPNRRNDPARDIDAQADASPAATKKPQHNHTQLNQP